VSITYGLFNVIFPLFFCYLLPERFMAPDSLFLFPRSLWLFVVRTLQPFVFWKDKSFAYRDPTTLSSGPHSFLPFLFPPTRVGLPSECFFLHSGSACQLLALQDRFPLLSHLLPRRFIRDTTLRVDALGFLKVLQATLFFLLPRLTPRSLFPSGTSPLRFHVAALSRTPFCFSMYPQTRLFE